MYSFFFFINVYFYSGGICKMNKCHTKDLVRKYLYFEQMLFFLTLYLWKKKVSQVPKKKQYEAAQQFQHS